MREPSSLKTRDARRAGRNRLKSLDGLRGEVQTGTLAPWKMKKKKNINGYAPSEPLLKGKKVNPYDNQQMQPSCSNQFKNRV